MKFDENKVYTALNADKLPIGSKVIVADNLADLKIRVSAYYDKSVTACITEICDIRTEDYTDRFEIVERHNSRYLYGHYGLAYLVSEPDDKLDCTYCKSKSSYYLMRLLSENIDKHNHLVAYKTILDKHGLLKEAEDLLTEILR